MRVLKSHPILSLVNSYIVDSPQPANISYMWNFGSLLGLCLVIQILTGIFLAMHYSPNVDLAFASVEHIMRDVNYGWAIRYTHANTASFFFICVYLHIARGLYYGSYRSPRTLPWAIGVIILVVMMATAFLGYDNSPKWFNIDLNTLNILPLTASSICTKHLVALQLSPKAVFENLNEDKVKQTVMSLIKEIAGVYVILNLRNGKTYVGSAITTRMPNRFHKHLYGLNGSRLVALAVKKYGISNFAFLVVDTVPGVVTAEDNKTLLFLENRYIQLLQPEYNIAGFAGNTFGVKHSPETLAAMRLNYSLERREQIGGLNRGNSLKPETIERIRAMALKRGKMSEESRIKVSVNSKMANIYSVTRVDGRPLEDGLLSITLVTIAMVATYCVCSERTVRRAIKGSGIIKGIWQVECLGRANPK